MTAPDATPLSYASPPAPPPRPGFWLVVCGALGWLFAVFGVLGILLHCGLIFATRYFDLPVNVEHEHARRLWALPGAGAYTMLGLVFLRLRYRKRGAE